jgi:CheY-like chemotaxis protein
MGRAILVVDDNWDIRQTLAELLRDEGHTVLTATDGWDGLQRLEDVRRPCLIFLDLMMPRMSGLEFLEHLGSRADRADFDVVVMSANDTLRREAQQYPNVRGAVRKPFDVEELLSLASGEAFAITPPNESGATLPAQPRLPRT